MSNKVEPPSAQAAHKGSELSLERVSKSFGSAVAVREVSFRVEPREFVTLLGPSGSGKTTILRMIGGFVKPDGGRIFIDGADVARLPVERRPTAMLFQQLSLWPHMTVAGNVGFGLQLRHRPKREIAQRVAELLSVVGLADFGMRLPSELSGGQQQRVALARALALEPRILLLDEPFSALDTKLRVELRNFVRSLQKRVGTTTLLVTHDQQEAMELSDRVVVLRDGVIEQMGSPAELYDTPRTPFVGEFLGTMNFVRASMQGDAIMLEGDDVVVPVRHAPSAFSGTALVGVRPEDVVVGSDNVAGDFVVESAIMKGHYNEVLVKCGRWSLRAYVARGTHLDVGGRCGLWLERAHVFADSTNEPAYEELLQAQGAGLGEHARLGGESRGSVTG